MTFPSKMPLAKHLPFGQAAMVIGLVMFGSQVAVTQAQLSPCTPLQQERGDTSCESPRENSKSLFDTMKGWLGLSSEEPKRKRESLRDLKPLPKPSFKNDPYLLDPIVKPNQPPIDGVRDYLNRQDPAHAIYPLEPGTSALDRR